MTPGILQQSLNAAVPYGKDGVSEKTPQELVDRTNCYILGAFDTRFSSTMVGSKLKSYIVQVVRSKLRNGGYINEGLFFKNAVSHIYADQDLTPAERLRLILTICFYMIILPTEDSRRDVILSSTAFIMCDGLLRMEEFKKHARVVDSFDVWKQRVGELMHSFNTIPHRVFDKGPTEQDKHEKVRQNNHKGIYRNWILPNQREQIRTKAISSQSYQPNHTLKFTFFSR